MRSPKQKRFDVNDVERLAVWASIECEKQQSGERSVGWMADGWSYIYRNIGEPVTVELIQRLGSIVEPRHNMVGEWRQMNVRVGTSVKAPWPEVPRLMGALVEAWPVLNADEWYRSFEEVHPFRDGNGRTGNILWNMHRGSLRPWKLQFPPDFWGYPRLEFPSRGAKVEELGD